MLKSILGSMSKVALVSVTCISVMNYANAQEKKVVNFGIISTESSQNLKSDWQPLLDDMVILP